MSVYIIKAEVKAAAEAAEVLLKILILNFLQILCLLLLDLERAPYIELMQMVLKTLKFKMVILMT